MNDVTDDYLDLMRAFISERLTAVEFQERFISMFKAESRALSEEVYLPLDRLFGDLDAFTPDDLLRRRVNASTKRWSPEEAQLRTSVQRTVSALERAQSG